MKKKLVSLAALLCFGVCFVSGCKKDEDGFEKLEIDGYDVVLKVGEDGTVYTANDLFKDMLNSEEGVGAAYEKLLKVIVENSVDTNSDMEASWELLLESFEEEVETKATSDGISKKEARKALLSEDGYASIEEKKEAYFYDVKLEELQEEFWELRKDYYFEEYFNNRLPYYVSHVLVKVANGYTDSDRAPYSTTITEPEAKNLYKVYKDLVNGEKFTDIMNVRSEDSGSKDGNGYMMDMTESFVSEFLHGVVSLDTIMKGKTADIVGITNTANYYLKSTSQSGEKDYNFNVIYASDLEALNTYVSVGDSSNERNPISTYEKDSEQKDVSVGTLSDGYGTSALDTRSIIFNRTFNEPGISVIAYDLKENLGHNNYIEMKINGETKKVLTDEKGNLVFVACARGSESNLQVHFLTINVSPFDTFDNTNGTVDAKLFFSIDKEKTVEKMVAEKKSALQQAGVTDETELNNQLEAYKTKLNNYKTYVELNAETQTEKNKVIEQIEERVKTYAKRGITSGAVSGKEEFMTFDMIDYYMDKGNITIADANIKSLIETHIANQKALIDLQSLNSIVGGWDDYYNKVTIVNSPEIENKKIPLECSYGVNAGATCKYNYDDKKGFEIFITYINGGTSNDADAYMPTTTYKTSFHLGDGVITLPVAANSSAEGMYREGWKFEGWYSTIDFKEGTEVTQIDPSRSSANNKVVVYAKWTEVGGGN